jgi:hypothetical protein
MKSSLGFLVIGSFLLSADSLRIVSTSHRKIASKQFKRASEVNRRQSPNLSNIRGNTKIAPISPELSQRIYSDLSNGDLIGEDAATFDLAQQSLKAWGTFLVAVGGILSFLFYVWIYDGGPVLGDHFKEIMESLAGGDTTLTITYMLAFFAVAHSGLASLRPAAEKIIGE